MCQKSKLPFQYPRIVQQTTQPIFCFPDFISHIGVFHNSSHGVTLHNDNKIGNFDNECKILSLRNKFHWFIVLLSKSSDVDYYVNET